MIGAEYIPLDTVKGDIYEIERNPLESEIAAWNAVKKTAHVVTLRERIIVLTLANISLAQRFCSDNGIVFEWDINTNDFVAVQNEIRKLKSAMRGVDDNVFALQFVGNDIDVVRPPKADLGAIWIPIAIGALIIGGIIMRWAQLEKETTQLSDHYNGILRQANKKLCKDPSSKMCADWQATKASGGYNKRETVIGNIKDAIAGTGTAVKKGLGLGALIALPILAIFATKGKR